MHLYICLYSGVWCVTPHGKSTSPSFLCWWDPSLDTWRLESLLTGKIFRTKFLHSIQFYLQVCNIKNYLLKKTKIAIRVKKVWPCSVGLAATRCWSFRCCSCWCLVWLWPSLSTSPCSAPCASLRASAWQGSPFLSMSSVSLYFSTKSSVPIYLLLSPALLVIVTTPVKLAQYIHSLPNLPLKMYRHFLNNTS